MRHQHRTGRLLFGFTFILLTAPLPCSASLVTNGGFDIPTPGLPPPNYPASISGASVFGPSSAEDWTLFNSRDATTSTELLPSTDPNGSGFMIHLTSVSNTGDPVNSFFNGLQQVFPVQPGGSASVDVYALNGPVILALYAGFGSTLLDYTVSSTTNAWETLSVSSASGDPNLIVLYSYSTSGIGEFYADGAGVISTVPEPSTGALALACLTAMAYVRGKVRRRARSSA